MNGIKHTLKGLSFVVVPLRFVRDLPKQWQDHRSHYREEEKLQQLIDIRERVIVDYLNTTESPRLQIGAGGSPLPGWLNTDLEPAHPGVLYLNGLDTFPFADNVFDYVFSEHMIEHIPYPGALSMLAESFRVLRPGGRLRVAAPDIRQIAALCNTDLTENQRSYIRWSVEHLGLYSSDRSELQKRRPEWDLSSEHLRTFFPQNDQDPACFVVNNFFRSYGHQFLYDKHTLSEAIRSVGFADVTMCSVGISSDDALCGIERHGLDIGEENNRFETMVVEAVRSS